MRSVNLFLGRMFVFQTNKYFLPDFQLFPVLFKLTISFLFMKLNPVKNTGDIFF